MKTNREKYEHFAAQIAFADQAAISSLIPEVPFCFYEIRNFEPFAVEVTHLAVHHRGIYRHDVSDRVTKAEVELAKKTADEWVGPTAADIMVHYRSKQTFGTVTGAHAYGKIGADSSTAWTADALAGEIERRRELYAPREGHIACDYCRKQTPDAALIDAKIFYRDQGGSKTKIGRYCSATCANHDQCGHEG